MRWKALFTLKGANDETNKKTYGFKSTNCPPQIEEVKAFADDMYHMVETISFRRASNQLQDKMRKDIKLIKDGAEIVAPADKTRNLYRVPVPEYEKLRRENITKKYKLAPENTYADINAEAKAIAVDLQLEDRMECLAKAQEFVTLKDHKDGFAESLPCRLITPAKSEVGVVSKDIIDGIIGPMRNDVCKNLWKNTSEVINWFKAIENKSRFTFIVFDIVDFYASITEDLLLQALDYAKTFATISGKKQTSYCTAVNRCCSTKDKRGQRRRRMDLST